MEYLSFFYCKYNFKNRNTYKLIDNFELKMLINVFIEHKSN